MSTTFERGQKVMILATESRHDTAHIGRTGTYAGREALGPRFVFRVRLDASNPFTDDTKIVRATHIQAAASPKEFSAGDRIIVKKVYYALSKWAEGKEGVYQLVNSRGQFVVRMPNSQGRLLNVVATDIEAAPKAAPASSTINALDVIDPARATAAALAHQILGESPLLEDLIGLAEFLLGTPPVREVAALDFVERAKPTRPVGGNSAAPMPEKDPEVMTLEDARKVVETDFESDDLIVALDKFEDDDVVRAFSKGGSTSFLGADHIDTLIRFLQAAKIVHAAR